ncbi:MAG: hypothetical protein HDT39_01340 [Lachnospiraceae bacterium]|nr:hypothetical protein [Lachnospiraceae bacterium]
MKENKIKNTNTDCICYHCVNPLCGLPHCESYSPEYCLFNSDIKSVCIKKECEYYLSEEKQCQLMKE